MRDNAPLLGWENNLTHRLRQFAFRSGQLRLQMFSGKLERDEAMPVMCLTRRAQRLIAGRIVTGAAWQIVKLRASATANRAASLEVETKFHAERPEAFAPIERLSGFEIVPLEAHPHLVETTVELLPPVAHIRPGHSCGSFGFHRVIFGCSLEIARTL